MNKSAYSSNIHNKKRSCTNARYCEGAVLSKQKKEPRKPRFFCGLRRYDYTIIIPIFPRTRASEKTPWSSAISDKARSDAHEIGASKRNSHEYGGPRKCLHFWGERRQLCQRNKRMQIERTAPKLYKRKVLRERCSFKAKKNRENLGSFAVCAVMIIKRLVLSLRRRP